MRNTRLSFLALLCACVLLAAHRLGGQTVVFSPGTPPPPPPAAAAGAPLRVVPPAPIGLPPEELPRFEVASVKKFEGRVTTTALRSPGGGRITLVNLPLRTIIMQAFGGIRDYQLGGTLPGWTTSDRFTITAKAETNAPRDQLMLMMRAVLVDRFQMKYHVEKKEMQAYVLTTAETEWKPTARMKPVDCTKAAPRTGPGPMTPEQMACSGGISLATSGITARGTTMANFVSLLGSLGGLGIIHDRTGLTGTYSIELDASPTALLRSLSVAQAMAGLPGGAGEPNLLPNVAEGRSLDSAIRDLGLRLTRQKEMVDVLVIDSLSQPDED